MQLGYPGDTVRPRHWSCTNRSSQVVSIPVGKLEVQNGDSLSWGSNIWGGGCRGIGLEEKLNKKGRSLFWELVNIREGRPADERAA